MRLLQILGPVCYFVVGLVQLFATVDGFKHWLGFSGFFAWIAALITAYFPVIGSVVGFAGAVNVWDWRWYWAALLFGWPVLLMAAVWVAMRLSGNRA